MSSLSVTSMRRRNKKNIRMKFRSPSKQRPMNCWATLIEYCPLQAAWMVRLLATSDSHGSQSSQCSDTCDRVKNNRIWVPSEYYIECALNSDGWWASPDRIQVGRSFCRKRWFHVRSVLSKMKPSAIPSWRLGANSHCLRRRDTPGRLWTSSPLWKQNNRQNIICAFPNSISLRKIMKEQCNILLER